MIKILHVISDRNIGGAGRLLLNLLKEADREKFDISVILPYGSLLTPKITEIGIKATESDLSIRSLYKVIKRKNPDIVHTHAVPTARVTAKLCGVSSTVNTKHCANDNAIKHPFYKRVAVRLFDSLFTTCTVATADYVKEVLASEGIPPRKTEIIINGSLPINELSKRERTEARRHWGYSEGDFIVGIVARLEVGKGQEYFIKAAEICQKKVPNIKFLVVGGGSMADELKAMAKGLHNLKFLGFVENVGEIMNILDANVNCSYISETSSLSLSEGMSVGAIPIVSDCGGNEFMAKGCGIVFPKQDAHALAEAIISLSKDSEAQKRLKSSAKERFFKEFTAKAMTKRTEDLYVRLAKKKNK